jgi:RNA polymerase sigma-70 factor (ECF subfamily)
MRMVKAVARREVGAMPATPEFDDIYQQHFDFVWRNLRRLGVPPEQLDDAGQDVFVVVHRRRGDFASRSTLRTWLFGIVLRVASDYRRKRSRANVCRLEEKDALRMPQPGPFELASRREAVELLERFLDSLSDKTRPVFILAELEEMTVPEVALALALNPNTVYSRLRLARRSFERAVDEWIATEGAK